VVLSTIATSNLSNSFGFFSLPACRRIRCITFYFIIGCFLPDEIAQIYFETYMDAHVSHSVCLCSCRVAVVWDLSCARLWVALLWRSFAIIIIDFTSGCSTLVRVERNFVSKFVSTWYLLVTSDCVSGLNEGFMNSIFIFIIYNGIFY